MRRICWVKWEKVCSAKRMEGQGFRHLRWFNECLLAEWSWALFNDHDSLWRQIIVSKYDGWRGLDEEVDKFVSLWWRDVQKVCGYVVP